MILKIAPGKELRIAISGKSGCGNTTVTKMLSDAIGIKMINYTFRQLAIEEKVSLAQVLEKAKQDDSYDIKIDTCQVEMAMEESCVLGSRLAIWMLKEADLKVYLLADENIRASRIYNREGGTIEDIKKFTALRDEQDTQRYKRIYNIDNNDYSFADIIIDTAKYNPEQICAIIIDVLVTKGFLISE